MRCRVRSLVVPDDAPPCTGAAAGTCLVVDERQVDDPAKVPARRGQREWWYDRGCNHRVEHGRIRRDLPERGWFLEVASVEDLLQLAREHGGLHVGCSALRPDVCEIVLAGPIECAGTCV